MLPAYILGVGVLVLCALLSSLTEATSVVKNYRLYVRKVTKEESLHWNGNATVYGLFCDEDIKISVMAIRTGDFVSVYPKHLSRCR
jgi:hypothetical protein